MTTGDALQKNPDEVVGERVMMTGFVRPQRHRRAAAIDKV
jgi:hypothetical protein